MYIATITSSTTHIFIMSCASTAGGGNAINTLEGMVVGTDGHQGIEENRGGKKRKRVCVCLG